MSSRIFINGLVEVSVVANADITANATYGPFIEPEPIESAVVAISIGGVSGTSPSLTVTFNAIDPYAYNYYLANGLASPPNPYYTVSSSSITAAGGYYVSIGVVFTMWELTVTVSGTSPSFTNTFISLIGRVSE